MIFSIDSMWVDKAHWFEEGAQPEPHGLLRRGLPRDNLGSPFTSPVAPCTFLFPQGTWGIHGEALRVRQTLLLILLWLLQSLCLARCQPPLLETQNLSLISGKILTRKEKFHFLACLRLKYLLGRCHSTLYSGIFILLFITSLWQSSKLGMVVIALA